MQRPAASLIPAIRLVRTYQRAWLSADALAAVTVWALLVPQALASAQLPRWAGVGCTRP